VRQKVQVELATSDLRFSLACERDVIEAALSSARRQQEVARRGPEYARHYEEAQARISAVLKEQRPRESSPAKIISAPDFNLTIADTDPAVARDLTERIAGLRHARRIFLDACLDELGRDASLKKLFWQAILKQKQPQLAEAFVDYAAGRGGK
jgi:hypothetical protein